MTLLSIKSISEILGVPEIEDPLAIKISELKAKEKAKENPDDELVSDMFFEMLDKAEVSEFTPNDHKHLIVCYKLESGYCIVVDTPINNKQSSVENRADYSRIGALKNARRTCYKKAWNRLAELEAYLAQDLLYHCS